MSIERMGRSVEQLDMESGAIAEAVKEFSAGADMTVDALFGTGLKGELKGGYRELIESINGEGKKVLAVDIPSGLDCDTGKPLGAAIRAQWTVTFVAVKKGFTCGENATDYTGEIFVASIGLTVQ